MKKNIRNISICLGLALSWLSVDANLVRANPITSRAESYLISDSYRRGYDYRRGDEDYEDYNRRDYERYRRNRGEYYNRRDYDRYRRNRNRNAELRRWCERQYERARGSRRGWYGDNRYANYERICGNYERYRRNNERYRYY